MEKTKREIPTCPICGGRLMFLMPSGTVLCCNKCDKCFKNDNGKAGKECDSPYKNPNALY